MIANADLGEGPITLKWFLKSWKTRKILEELGIIGGFARLRRGLSRWEVGEASKRSLLEIPAVAVADRNRNLAEQGEPGAIDAPSRATIAFHGQSFPPNARRCSKTAPVPRLP